MKLKTVTKIVVLDNDDIIKFVEMSLQDDPGYYLEEYIREEETITNIYFDRDNKLCVDIGK